MLSETIFKFKREVEKFIKALEVVWEEHNRIDWTKVSRENVELIHRSYNKIVENIERVMWEMNRRWRYITEEYCLMVRLKEGVEPEVAERLCLVLRSGK